jgi:hypothetical protein
MLELSVVRFSGGENWAGKAAMSLRLSRGQLQGKPVTGESVRLHADRSNHDSERRILEKTIVYSWC